MKIEFSKGEKGITLIALIITIIILLILAGVTIGTLSRTGIFNKAKQTATESEKQRIIEEIKMNIWEIEIESEAKGEVFTLNSLAPKLLSANSNIVNAEYNEDEKIIIGTYRKGNKNHAFFIDENMEIASYTGKGNTEFTYEILSEDQELNLYNIKVIAKNRFGIKSIVLPSGVEQKYDLQEVVIDNYQIEKNKQYTFSVKYNDEEEEDFTLNPNDTGNITIVELASNAFPTITEKGIIVGKSIKIESEDNSNLYYSLDNGNTWNKYENTIFITEQKTLKAKKINKNTVNLIVSKNIGFALATNAMGLNAYDDDVTTSWTYYFNNREQVDGRVNIDSSAWGKKIKVKFYSNHNGYNGGFKFYNNESSTPIGQIKVGTSTTFDDTYTIPDGATYLICFKENGNGEVTVYDLKIADEPTIEYTAINPLIKSTGVEKPYWDVEIKYAATSVIKQYKINDGEWKNYDGTHIKLPIGDTIYARGYDEDGKITRIVSSKQAVLSNAMGLNAYDDDITSSWTYYYDNRAQVDGRVDIDSSMWGKKIKAKFYSNVYGYNGGFKFYNNESSTPIGQIKVGTNTTFNDTYTIPEGATYLICFKENGKGELTVYDLSVYNE